MQYTEYGKLQQKHGFVQSFDKSKKNDVFFPNALTSKNKETVNLCVGLYLFDFVCVLTCQSLCVCIASLTSHMCVCVCVLCVCVSVCVSESVCVCERERER
jgi:hypothetical protein